MTKEPRAEKPADPSKNRQDRLKAALKANLARRKSQTRARGEVAAGAAADRSPRTEDR